MRRPQEIKAELCDIRARADWCEGRLSFYRRRMAELWHEFGEASDEAWHAEREQRAPLYDTVAERDAEREAWP